jgi:stage V sporulation protein S
MKTQKTDIVEERGEGAEIILRVAGGSQVKAVAGAIGKTIREKNVPIIVAIGAGAVNQAIKAICVARGMLAPEGVDIVVKPGFKDEEINGQPRTAIRMQVLTI